MVRVLVGGLTRLFGEDIVNVLRTFGYRHDRTRGDHVIPKYTHPQTGEKRTVTVPLHDRVRVGSLQSIAEQAGRTTSTSGAGG
ncbi:type II toxin-antitoxin system HicA family toxin [Candidatus Halobonum tyrrellensis]|uniref:Putative periplasmic or secreted lipoprotein n=1 Tax=Candidatus Halobonum tyrrellensis G22 TaxID=1324957 RepID=V4IVY6_9EURY|nr:type II toxin-antitoxin system HicA family toxin [Candidatus Halobonum tyrrellensis]ESP87312.1 putative periplasmic or secreted lipoprotein [Candidatus Halobonum tyrrellensis G22]